MFETNLRASVAKAAVRKFVYASSNQDSSSIAPVHLDLILDALAQFFLCHFVLTNTSEARLCNPRKIEIVRVDPWALSPITNLKNLLPVDSKSATQTIFQCENLLAFVDLELWVLDCEKIRSINNSSTGKSKLVNLFEGFDGWSICFPTSAYPEDIGTFMDDVAKTLAISRASVPLPKNPVGRPTKIDKVIRCISAAYPDGLLGAEAKVVLREIEKDLAFPVGLTTVRTAMKQVSSAQQ